MLRLSLPPIQQTSDLEKIVTFMLDQKSSSKIKAMKTVDEIYQSIADNIKSVIGKVDRLSKK